MSFALAFLYQGFISLSKEESKAKTVFGGRVSRKAGYSTDFPGGGRSLLALRMGVPGEILVPPLIPCVSCAAETLGH